MFQRVLSDPNVLVAAATVGAHYAHGDAVHVAAILGDVRVGGVTVGGCSVVGGGVFVVIVSSVFQRAEQFRGRLREVDIADQRQRVLATVQAPTVEGVSLSL